MRISANNEVLGFDEERNGKQHDLRIGMKDAEGEQQSKDGAQTRLPLVPRGQRRACL